MDIVVRTPHGDADITVGGDIAHSTLGDLVGRVTGQAVPRLADVDGRAVDCATPLADVGLVIGSLVTTDPPAPEARHPDDVQLVQITGRGAGRTARLSAGRFRVGPGRRAFADELGSAPVERTAFEVVVDADGDVNVDPDNSVGEVRLGGSPIRSATQWGDDILCVADRAFVIDRRPPSGDRRLAPPDVDGTVAFSRPPRRHGEPRRLPVIDAAREATGALSTLWQRRPGQPDAFSLAIGLRAVDDDEPVTFELDVFGERAVAVCGAELERYGIARTILVEAVTLHGPADLDVVVITRPDRVAEWEWAKWLPHLRLGGRPMVLSTLDDITQWAIESADRRLLASTPWLSAHLTLVVIDDATLWQRRDSPLRQVLSAAPADLRVVALCDDSAHAPAMVTTLITPTTDGWRVAALTSRHDVDGVLLAFTEPSVAAEVARALAPLADTDLPSGLTTSPGHLQRSLAGLFGDSSVDAVRRRFAVDDLSAVVIGSCDDGDVAVDLTAGNVLVTGTHGGDVQRVTVTIGLLAAAGADPSTTWVLDLVGPRGCPGLAPLPHATDPSLTADDLGATEPDRLVAVLGRTMAQDGPPTSILVLVDRTTDRELADALIDATQGPSAIDGLVLIVAESDSTLATPPAGFATTVTTWRSGGERRATITLADGTVTRPFQLDHDDSASDLTVLPAVLGRPLSPLEHRLDHAARNNNAVSAEFERLSHQLREAAGQVEVPTLMPRRLPTSIDADEMFAAYAGDAIPIGLLDTPTPDPQALWWQPDPGIVLAIGSVRSGVDDVLATILLGLVDRFGVDDVSIALVDRSASRRRVVEALTQSALVVDPERVDDVVALIDLITRPRSSGESMLVVLVDDVGRLRDQAAMTGRIAELDAALSSSADPRTRCAVVGIARSADACGPLVALARALFVGAMNDPAEARRLGLSYPIDGPRGRCRQMPGDRLVQLSVPDRPITTALPQRVRETTSRSDSGDES
jgi:hypothetical protein